MLLWSSYAINANPFDLPVPLSLTRLTSTISPYLKIIKIVPNVLEELNDSRIQNSNEKDLTRNLLGKNGEEIAFGEIEGNAAGEDISGFFVLGVP